MNKHSASMSVEGLLLHLHSEHSISGNQLNELYTQLHTSRKETNPAPEAYELTGLPGSPRTCPRFDIDPTILTPAPSMTTDDSDTAKKARTKPKKGKGKKPKADREEKEELIFNGLRMNGVSRAEGRANTVESNENHNIDARVEFRVDDTIGDKPSGEPLGAVLITWYGDGGVCLRPYKGPLSG